MFTSEGLICFLFKHLPVSCSCFLNCQSSFQRRQHQISAFNLLRKFLLLIEKDLWLITGSVTGLDLKTHIERQNLHWCVEQFVSRMFDVSAPKEISGRYREMDGVREAVQCWIKLSSAGSPIWTTGAPSLVYKSEYETVWSLTSGNICCNQ